jgi:hypothetical protein
MQTPCPGFSFSRPWIFQITGSYTYSRLSKRSLLIQSNNLRDMATIARLPPARALICSYFFRMALSFRIKCQQDSTKADRTAFLPAPVMRPILILSALEYCDGVKPTYAANCSARRKREKSCNSNKISMAVRTPIPGMEHKIFTRSLYNGNLANCLSN